MPQDNVKMGGRTAREGKALGRGRGNNGHHAWTIGLFCGSGLDNLIYNMHVNGYSSAAWISPNKLLAHQIVTIPTNARN